MDDMNMIEQEEEQAEAGAVALAEEAGTEEHVTTLFEDVVRSIGSERERINEAEGERGFTVHYPARDTYQVDDIGYRIATDNSVANGGAQHIVIYYAQTSVGSYFDLGVSYYFQYADPSRTFTMMNEGAVVMNEADFGDRIVLTLLEKAGRLPERA